MGAHRIALQELAPLRDTPATKREELFKKKLELCSICFDFEDPTVLLPHKRAHTHAVSFFIKGLLLCVACDLIRR